MCVMVGQAERADADMERRELERTRIMMTKSIEKEMAEVKKEVERQKVEAAALERDRSALLEKVRALKAVTLDTSGGVINVIHSFACW